MQAQLQTRKCSTRHSRAVNSTSYRAARAVSVRASRSTSDNQPKVIHLMRHGVTELNTFLREVCAYEDPGFKDPMMFDTVLTPEGIKGAKAAAAVTRDVTPEPELLVVSPLTRAIKTADYAWPHYDGPVVVEALARERVWLSGDCGRVTSELKQDFRGTRWQDCFDHLPDIWWWDNGTQDPTHISLEPEEVFVERVNAFRQWLQERPENNIAVVAHWGLLLELTHGQGDFRNCELRTYHLTAETGRLVQVADSKVSARVI